MLKGGGTGRPGPLPASPPGAAACGMVTGGAPTPPPLLAVAGTPTSSTPTLMRVLTVLFEPCAAAAFCAMSAAVGFAPVGTVFCGGTRSWMTRFRGMSLRLVTLVAVDVSYGS